VNAYLRANMGPSFSAKEFRTWSGTLTACKVLLASDPCTSDRAGNRTLAQALDRVAAELGNTRAVCRKSYVDPLLFDCYLKNSLRDRFRSGLSQAQRRRGTGLTLDEHALVLMLETWRRKSPRSLVARGSRSNAAHRAGMTLPMAARRAPRQGGRVPRRATSRRTT